MKIDSCHKGYIYIIGEKGIIVTCLNSSYDGAWR